MTDLVGRILLSFIFLYDAYDSIFYFQETKMKMTFYGLTWRQDLLLVGAIFLLILGGTSLLTGYRVRLGVLLLLVYWTPVTFIVHAFWNAPAETERLESVLFMKNIALIGALLMVWANGAGRFVIRKLFATARVPRR